MAREVVIIDAISTPFGSKSKVEKGLAAAADTLLRKRKPIRAAKVALGLNQNEYGALHFLSPIDLAARPLNALLERNSGKLMPEDIEDVVLGCSMQTKSQALDIARLAVLAAGLPQSVPGVTVNRICASGLTAFSLAAAKIGAEQADVLIAGGVEHMNKLGMFADSDRRLPKSLQARLEGEPHQLLAAERIAKKWGLSREELDRYAASSFERYAQGRAADRYNRFLVPIAAPNQDGLEVELAEHEGVRLDTTFEKLSALRTVVPKSGFVITAGNSSRIVDGASAVLLTSSGVAAHLGLKPRARILACRAAGSDPNLMLTGPIESSRKALAAAGLKVDDIGLWEINEAFAPVVIVATKELGLDPARVNIIGGAIAHGHPIGATGTMLVAKALSEMELGPHRYAAISMCVGFGMAETVVIERMD